MPPWQMSTPRKGNKMSENNTENRKNNKSSITTGATALISVLAVPVTLLAGLLLSNRKKK